MKERERERKREDQKIFGLDKKRNLLKVKFFLIKPRERRKSFKDLYYKHILTIVSDDHK